MTLQSSTGMRLAFFICLLCNQHNSLPFFSPSKDRMSQNIRENGQILIEQCKEALMVGIHENKQNLIEVINYIINKTSLLPGQIIGTTCLIVTIMSYWQALNNHLNRTNAETAEEKEYLHMKNIQNKVKVGTIFLTVGIIIFYYNNQIAHTLFGYESPKVGIRGINTAIIHPAVIV